jgi:hypothetical protein
LSFAKIGNPLKAKGKEAEAIELNFIKSLLFSF